VRDIRSHRADFSDSGPSFARSRKPSRAATTSRPLAADLWGDVDRDATPSASSLLAIQFAVLDHIELTDGDHSVRDALQISAGSGLDRAGIRSSDCKREAGRRALDQTVRRLGQRGENVKSCVDLVEWQCRPRRF
jgi:hypothetical protein